MLLTHAFPRVMPRSDVFRCWINEQPVEVLSAHGGDFISLETDGPFDVRVEVAPSFGDPEGYRVANAAVRPERLQIAVDRKGYTFRFRVPGPECVLFDILWHRPLSIFARVPEGRRPNPDDPRVHYFRSGQVYEQGLLYLKDGETAYLEPGAVFRGSIWAQESKDTRMAGYGVLDNGYFKGSAQGKRYPVLFDTAQGGLIEDLTLINCTHWNLVLGNSRDTTVRRVQIISEGGGSDGIDVVGSQDCLIEDCYLLTGDDSLVIKGFNQHEIPQWVRETYRVNGPFDYKLNNWDQDVLNIRFRRCRVLTNEGGSNTEIGFETRVGRVANIVYEDLDLMGNHTFGSVFGIHNGDQATVENVVWRNVRVEHCYDKLVDFRVLASRWNADTRGQIRNIRLENCDIHVSDFNAGYTTSVISGFDEHHTAENIHFQDFRMKGKKALKPEDVWLSTLHAKNVMFS